MTLAEAARRRNEARRNRTAESPQGTVDSSPSGTSEPSSRGTASAKAPLFGWPLLLGIVGVAILLALSLLTGVYDIFGGAIVSKMNNFSARALQDTTDDVDRGVVPIEK